MQKRTEFMASPNFDNFEGCDFKLHGCILLVIQLGHQFVLTNTFRKFVENRNKLIESGNKRVTARHTDIRTDKRT